MTGMEDVTAEDIEYANLVASVSSGIECKQNTISLAKRALAEGVPGDFAECGVCAGTHPAIMAYVQQRYGGGDRKVHLFDSFEKGFTKEPVNSVEDLARASAEDLARCEPDGVVMTSVAQVQQNMARWLVPQQRLVYHAGWVQETLPAIADGLPALALLRIDVDLYSPNAAVFKYLYDKVSPGGYIISDDWGEYDLSAPDSAVVGARLAAFQFFHSRGIERPTVTRVIGGTVWWRKP